MAGQCYHTHGLSPSGRCIYCGHAVAVDERQEVIDATVPCPYCKTVNDSDKIYCTQCKRGMNAETTMSDRNLNEAVKLGIEIPKLLRLISNRASGKGATVCGHRIGADTTAGVIILLFKRYFANNGTMQNKKAARSSVIDNLLLCTFYHPPGYDPTAALRLSDRDFWENKAAFVDSVIEMWTGAKAARNKDHHEIIQQRWDELPLATRILILKGDEVRMIRGFSLKTAAFTNVDKDEAPRASDQAFEIMLKTAGALVERPRPPAVAVHRAARNTGSSKAGVAAARDREIQEQARNQGVPVEDIEEANEETARQVRRHERRRQREEPVAVIREDTFA